MRGLDRWILVAILAVAALARMVAIESALPGPNPDEACNIVDARCLFESGADQHGATYPIYLRAFGDYREGVFVYLASAFVSSAQRPLAAIRLFSAAVGVATVLLVYLAGRSWAKEEAGARIGAWAAYFLATNPQHILWSRLGMEVILVPFALVLCLVAFFSFADGKRGGALFVALSVLFLIYAGMMGKPLAAILLVLMAGSWLAGGIDRPRRFPWIELIVLLVGLVPAGLAILDGRATSRLDWIQEGAPQGWESFAAAAHRYLTYWSPRYLVESGGDGLPSLPGTANLGWAGTVALAAGIAVLAWRRPRHGWLLLALAALIPIPAAFTSTIAPSRVLATVPVQCLIMGHGIVSLTRGRGRWGSGLALLVAAGQALTMGHVARDLAGPAAAHLDRFFRGPQARMIEAAWSRHADSDWIVVDTALVYAPIQAIAIARPPRADFQGKLLDLYRLRQASLPVGKLLFDFQPGFKLAGRPERIRLITHLGAGPPGWKLAEHSDDIGLYASPAVGDGEANAGR